MIKESPNRLLPKYFTVKLVNSYDQIVNWTTFGKDSFWKHKILEHFNLLKNLY